MSNFSGNLLLTTNGLSKSYERRGEKFFAVNNVSLAAEAGSFICITGESGSGKSTLLNMLTGLLSADSGEIWFDGINLCKLEDTELTDLRCGKIGYIPQGNSLLYNFSVLENILLPRYLMQREQNLKGEVSQKRVSSNAKEQESQIKNIARDLLAKTGIAHLENENPRSLSGGEARRVAIARSLIMSPKIIIADEPTADLDPGNAEEIIRLLADVNSASAERVGVIIATHHEQQIRHCANKHYVMDSGKLTQKT